MTTMMMAAAAAQALSLSVNGLHVPYLPTSTPIVGRATCGDRAHLLTRLGELVEVTSPRRPVSDVHMSPDLATKRELWGLACLSDGSLWTLESGHSLVRLTQDARVAERIRLTLPWIALFGHGDRMLFQSLPTLAGVPVLSAAAPTALQATRSWPGPVGRAGAGGASSIARNLLRCGVPGGGYQACWFVDDGTIVLSNGKNSQSLAIPAGYRAALDTDMPIWDAAVVSGPRLWVIGMSTPGPRERRSADTVIAIGPRGQSARIRLPRSARLIVFAAFDRCTVLLASGEFVEIRAS